LQVRKLSQPCLIPSTDIISTGAFLFLVATAGYAGLSSLQVENIGVNDKVLHCITFFILTTCFYWILDTSRRRNLNFTLLVCTGILGIGSEFLQRVIPNRTFDFYDIVANIVGSLGALALSSWYHMRMLERKRLAKHYQVVPGEEEHDLELGEGVGVQESGEITASAPTLDEEVDNWDENIEDAWDEEGQDITTDSAEGDGKMTPSASSAGEPVEAEVKRKD
jgi:VanZ family protein